MINFRYFLLAGAFCFMFAVGFFSMQQSWNGVVFLHLNDDERIPAAIKRTHDLTKYSGVSLLKATQEHLITSSKIVHYSPVKAAVVLGHFITRNPDKNHKQVSACDIYEKVEVTLTAKGIANAGAVPTMIIEAPCKISKFDNSYLEPIWINPSEITKHVPGDLEFEFEVTHRSHIKFKDVIDSWPSEWELQTVKLFGSLKGAADTIEVSVTSLPKSKQYNKDRVLSLK